MSRRGTEDPESRGRGGGEAVGGLVVALAAVQFGSVVVLGKIAGRHGLPIPSMLAVRFGVAGLLLGAGILAVRRSLRPARDETLIVLALGVGYALESGLFFLGLARGTAAAVTLLFYTYPVWVAVLSMITGAGMPGWIVGGSLVAAVAGAALVVATGPIAITPLGVAFSLGAAVTFAVYYVTAARFVRRTPSPQVAAWTALMASVSLGILALATGSRAPSGREWLPVLGMGAFTSGAFLGLFVGLRRLGPVRSSIVSALEAVAAAVLAAVFLGERVPPGTVIGGILILGGAVAATAARARIQPEVP